MREARYTRSSRSSRVCSDGFSVLEVLVALTATGVIAGATLVIALSSRGMFETDQYRTTVNQNLRAGLDLLGIDVRQAGERMPWDAPAVQIIDGASGAPDELVLCRNMLDYVLPVCKDINAGTSADSIFVGKKKVTAKVPPGCYPVPDDNGDGWPDNLEQWRNYRIANGGSVLAYIHNPISGEGEFFVYDAEDNSTFHLHKDNSDNWDYDYPVNQNPRVYMLEAKRFRLDADILQSVINDDTANALNLVNHIEDLQIRAFLKDGTIVNSLTGGVYWTDLESLEVTLVGEAAFGDRTMERTVVTHYFPRNILSN